MSLQHSIKHLSAIALIGLVWGCNTSKQAIVSKSSSGEVYDDLYASTSDVRPTTLGGRIYNEQGYDESTYQAPVYRNGNSTNNSTQGTNEYYSQNWLNSRSVYQNQDDYSAGYNNGYNNGFANGLNNRYGNFGLNNWYANPAISFGLGYSRWSPFGFSTMGYYDPFYSNFNDPFWGWSSSRWMYGNSFGYGYNPYGFGSFYDPYGYGFSSLAYGGGFYGGYYNNYNNYVGSVIGAETPAKYRSRPAYAASAYNSDFNNNRGAAYNRGSRTNADYSNTNSDYYSRPRRDGSGVNYNTGTTTNSSRSSNSNYSNGRNNSWDWSSNNNNSRTNNTTTNSTWNNSSSGSSSSGSSGGGGGGGRSRGPR
ncbi:hypothetical protein [Flectobacillus sp. BAB-3569]|uniref:hypothetical protein n=1 Tax=Flectobacillus sp. BAB-3569 TaxID=1509483 RepID=UPI000BA46C80|nr:hypothetical protein [Flectobacillus sp. BAB-3569]NBA74504.1 hypothetical protein [Emticicia sp. ODNR4P]PAC31035.1 hypothetical protein BWI92_09875 [Flectobacillus sp. BAB-3569]